MATKPSSVPTWNTSGDNNTEPASGKKATGWTVGEQPPSSYFNWWMKLVYEWCAYLSDGALTGAITMASTLGVTGAVTFASTLAVTGLITATAGLTAGANAHITVSGTGRFKHGDLTMFIAATEMELFNLAGSGTHIASAGGQPIANAGGGSDLWMATIQLPVGKRIRSLLVYHKRASGTSTYKLWDYNVLSDTRSQLGATITLSSGTSLTSSPIASVDTAVASAHSYILEWATGGANDQFYVWTSSSIIRERGLALHAAEGPRLLSPCDQVSPRHQRSAHT